MIAQLQFILRNKKLNCQFTNFGKYSLHIFIKKFSIKEDHIYGWYNPYTTTGRPVNNFNGLNFVGLKHDNGERDCFEPDNDFFVEMDYDGSKVTYTTHSRKFTLNPRKLLHNNIKKVKH